MHVNNHVGRRRRKKCDEKRPRCGGCTRNNFECRWPSETQAFDRRRYPRSSGSWRNRSSSVTTAATTTAITTADEGAAPVTIGHDSHLGRSLPPPVSLPAPFHKEEHLRLYRYFAHSIAPKLVRQTSLSKYAEALSFLRLALVHAPLMGVLVAIAGTMILPHSPDHQALALQSYLFAITSVKTGIREGHYAGTEDWLLATTTYLCIFEVLFLPPLLNPPGSEG